MCMCDPCSAVRSSLCCLCCKAVLHILLYSKWFHSMWCLLVCNAKCVPVPVQELRKQTQKCPICRNHVESMLHIKVQKPSAGQKQQVDSTAAVAGAVRDLNL